MWSLGCVLFCIGTRESVAFSEPDRVRYCDGVQSFNHRNLSINLGKDGISLIQKLLSPDPYQRPNAKEALLHPWFIGSATVSPHLLQTSPAPDLSAAEKLHSPSQHNYNSFLQSTLSTQSSINIRKSHHPNQGSGQHSGESIEEHQQINLEGNRNTKPLTISNGQTFREPPPDSTIIDRPKYFNTESNQTFKQSVSDGAVIDQSRHLGDKTSKIPRPNPFRERPKAIVKDSNDENNHRPGPLFSFFDKGISQLKVGVKEHRRDHAVQIENGRLESSEPCVNKNTRQLEDVINKMQFQSRMFGPPEDERDQISAESDSDEIGLDQSRERKTSQSSRRSFPPPRPRRRSPVPEQHFNNVRLPPDITLLYGQYRPPPSAAPPRAEYPMREEIFENARPPPHLQHIYGQYPPPPPPPRGEYPVPEQNLEIVRLPPGIEPLDGKHPPPALLGVPSATSDERLEPLRRKNIKFQENTNRYPDVRRVLLAKGSHNYNKLRGFSYESPAALNLSTMKISQHCDEHPDDHRYSDDGLRHLDTQRSTSKVESSMDEYAPGDSLRPEEQLRHQKTGKARRGIFPFFRTYHDRFPVQKLPQPQESPQAQPLSSKNLELLLAQHGQSNRKRLSPKLGATCGDSIAPSSKINMKKTWGGI